jgi:hypothetical protein
VESVAVNEICEELSKGKPDCQQIGLDIKVPMPFEICRDLSLAMLGREVSFLEFPDYMAVTCFPCDTFSALRLPSVWTSAVSSTPCTAIPKNKLNSAHL